MPAVPGVYKQELEDRRYILTEQGLVRGRAAVLDRDTRSPFAPDHWIEPGTVIVRRQGSGRFVHASHPDGRRNQPASVSSLQPADPAWANAVLTTSLARGLGFAVLLDANAVDNAAVIDQLNQSPSFAAHFLADEDANGHVRVRTRGSGAHRHLHVVASLPAAFGVDGRAGHGVDADYRVTDAWADMRELGAGAAHYLVPTVLAGHFDESQLLHLTSESRVVLARRGSIFG